MNEVRLSMFTDSAINFMIVSRHLETPCEHHMQAAVPSGGDCFFLHRALAGIHLPHGMQAAPCNGWCGWWEAHRKRASETERKPSTRDLPRWLSDKESACQCRRPKRRGFDPRKIPWRRKWEPTPVFLPWRILGQGSLQATVHRVAKSSTRLGTHTLHQHSQLQQEWLVGPGLAPLCHTESWRLADKTMGKLTFEKGQELMGQEEVTTIISGRENSARQCTEG